MLRVTFLLITLFGLANLAQAQLTMTCGEKTITVDSLTKVPADFFQCGELTLKLDRPEKRLDGNIILCLDKERTAYFQKIYFINGVAKVPQNFLYSRDWGTKVLIQILDKGKAVKVYSYIIQAK